MFELFRHPWFKNWGKVIDTDVKKVLNTLKRKESKDVAYVDTLISLLENTVGLRCCGSLDESYFHISQISRLFERREECNTKEFHYAELILVAKGSISQLALLYDEIIKQTLTICASISYWENVTSMQDWIMSISPYSWFRKSLKSNEWICREERLKRLNAMLSHRQDLLGRLGAVLEKLGMLRRDFSVGKSTFELNSILLTTVAMVTRVVSHILFPSELNDTKEKDFLNGRRVRVMSEHHANYFQNQLKEMHNTFRDEFENIKRPSVWRRRWFEMAASGAVFLYVTWFCVRYVFTASSHSSLTRFTSFSQTHSSLFSIKTTRKSSKNDETFEKHSI